MDMEEVTSRKLTPEEVADIVMGAESAIGKKLEEGAVLVPKLIRAGLEFYMWLVKNDRIEETEGQSRDVIKDMLLKHMKERAE